MDVVSAVKDEFIDNEAQTPHITTQGTARDKFADDARCFERLRRSLQQPATVDIALPSQTGWPASVELSLAQRFEAAEKIIPRREQMDTFIGNLFDAICNNLPIKQFADFYECETSEKPDFSAPITIDYIVRKLIAEKRIDDFVRAKVTRKKKRRNPWDPIYFGFGSEPDDYNETYELDLNCQLAKAQLLIDFKPKFSVLERITSVITCAPSLYKCFVFHNLSSHQLTDLGKYDEYGSDLSKRSSTCNWRQPTSQIATAIVDTITSSIKSRIEKATSQLIDDLSTD